MKTAATIFLVLGMVLGILGGALQLLPIAMSDSLNEIARSNSVPANVNPGQFQEALKNATDPATGHVLSICAWLALAIAGGGLGIAGARIEGKRIVSLVLVAAPVAAGLGLLALRHWICAGLLVIGGLLALLDVQRTKEQSDDSPDPV